MTRTPAEVVATLREELRFGVDFLRRRVLRLALLFVGPTLDTPSGLATQAVAQKLIIYASLFNIGLQALGVRGHLSAL